MDSYRQSHPGDQVELLDLWNTRLPPFDGDVAVKFKKNADPTTHIRAKVEPKPEPKAEPPKDEPASETK